MLKPIARSACAVLPLRAAAEAIGLGQPDALRLRSFNANRGAALRQASSASDADELAAMEEAPAAVPLIGVEAGIPKRMLLTRARLLPTPVLGSGFDILYPTRRC